MSVADYCTADVLTLQPESTAAEAARVMREGGIGCVVVPTAGGPAIVTDRDLVVRGLAERRDPKELRLSEIASAPAATVAAESSLLEAAALMRVRAVRRLPVVSRSGELVGIIAFDDLLDLLGRELSDIAGAIRGVARSETPAIGGA